MNAGAKFQGAVAGQLWTVDGVYLQLIGTLQKKRPLWRVVQVSPCLVRYHAMH